MVSSFPEFDYTTSRSNKGGCVPTSQKPSRLQSSLHSQSSADSTILSKILSFHGSFSSYSNRNMRKRTQTPGLADSASKFKGTKSSKPSAADIETHTALPQCEYSSDPAKHNVAATNAISASKIERKWSSYKSARSHSSTSSSRENNSGAAAPDSDLLQRGCDSPGIHSAATEMGNLASRMGQACSPQSSVISQSGDLHAQGDKFAAHKFDQVEVDDYAPRLKDKCSTQDGNLVTKQGNVGTQKLDSIDVSAKCVSQSSLEHGEESAVKNTNSADRSKNASETSSNDVCNLEPADTAQTKENPHKVSSSTPGAPNSIGENYPVYASDNSSNNMRWSSTSCTSTDTSNSNSTRRSSCELRIPSAAPPPFLAKPHKAHDAAWAAIRRLQLQQGGIPLAITHFNLIRRVGHGDIGSVFVSHLKDKLVASPLDTSILFAIKVMDKDALSQRNKLQRMHMEKEILECVDHPFLPTLYAHFDSEHFSCLVMDFCPGGDLYALRQKQPGKRFGLIAARFYAAEVLLALEYLHMLGIVYRDLKPENVLVREDGHIMLTDFDLSLKADVKPELVKHPLLSSASLSNSSSKRRLLRSYSQSSTLSSSSTTSFLHHESSNCRLPAACTIDPIISCLTLKNNASKRAPQISKQQSPIGFSTLSSKVSKVSHAHTLSHMNDGSISEPLRISKEDVLGSESTSLTSKDVERSAKMSSTYSRSNASHHHELRSQLSKESHDSAGHSRAQKSHGVDSMFTSGFECQEDDPLMFMELIAEPTQARSMSFVGTHEYLAPEIIAGYGHGSPVDWWTFGIFLYELLYGRSPFKGASNDQTLINIIRQSLRFPETGTEMEGIEDAKCLIQGLLIKDPRRRLGCTKGAAEIKQHAFFKGVNWALIRCTQPPEVPSPCKKGMHASSNHHPYHHHHHHSKSLHQFDYF